jgi:HSP90 family molecular chaperone
MKLVLLISILALTSHIDVIYSSSMPEKQYSKTKKSFDSLKLSDDDEVDNKKKAYSRGKKTAITPFLMKHKDFTEENNEEVGVSQKALNKTATNATNEYSKPNYESVSDRQQSGYGSGLGISQEEESEIMDLLSGMSDDELADLFEGLDMDDFSMM